MPDGTSLGTPPQPLRNNIEQWWDLGYSAISIAPPGVEATGTLVDKPLGKIPGYVMSDDRWAGLDLKTSDLPAVREAMVRSCEAGAGIGIKGERFPGFDLDIPDAELVDEMRQHIIARLGWAPTRVGRSPKMLLMYRLAAERGDCLTRPIKLIFPDGTKGEICLIGLGRQYVCEGIHPDTLKPYTWDVHPLDCDELLTEITDYDLLWTVLRELRDMAIAAGAKVGSSLILGNRGPAPDQATLQGPKELVLSALAAVPNTTDTDRNEWILMGMALKAASGGQWDVPALQAWIDWSLTWVPPPGGTENTDEECERNWVRMKPPFRVGAKYVFDRAREHGWEDGGRATALLFANDPIDPEQLQRLDAQLEGSQPTFDARRATDTDHVVPEDDGALLADEPALVDGLIPLEGTAMIYGPSGGGKSAVAVALAAHVASGSQFFGREVEQGAVVYVALEGRGGIRKRFLAWQRQRRRPAGLPVILSTFPLDLLSRTSVSAFTDHLRCWSAKLSIAVRLVVVDTLAAATGAGDENDSSTAKATASALRRIADDARVLVLAIHHAGKDRTRGARGHSSIAANMDSRFVVDEGVLRVERQRDLEGEGDIFGFSLETIELGRGRHGRRITSAVMVEDKAPASAPRAMPPLKPNPAGALKVLRGLTGGDHNLPIDEAVFVDEAAKEVSGTIQKRRRQTARRALQSLRALGRVVVHDGLVALHPGPARWRFTSAGESE
jgi:hypothetical protein